MKILSVSDITVPLLYEKFDSERFSSVDLILSCGDLPPEYLVFLRNRIGAPLLYVLGNHDVRFMNTRPAGCVDIHANLVEFEGIRILGLEGSRWYNGGPYQYKEAEMRKTIRKLRPLLWWKKGVDIVITHAPPRYVNDEEDLCHRGFKSFNPLIEKYRPRYFIHGHIHRTFDHPDQRITLIGQTCLINTCGFYIFEYENEGQTEQI